MSESTTLRRLAYRLWCVTVLAALAYPLSLGPPCWTLSWLEWEERPEISHTVSQV